MDPDETLAEIREIVRLTTSNRPLAAETSFALAEAISDLDVWLSRGGFLPAAWSGSRDS